MDADTLYAIVEFAERDTQHFVVILLLEEGNSDISDIKYHNIKEMTEQEWLDVFENWSRSLEEAERIYLTKVARPKKVLASEIHNKHTPDDYWGEWSSDEEGQGQSEDVVEQEREKESEDSEDEYYTRWSKDPGTLTPGPEKSLKVINQQEIEEEYDQSYNPLFTVPSVPNLMDAHTAALSELTQILQTSLPQQQQQQQAKIEKFPGAYPESGAQTPFVEQTRYYQEAGRQLFMKSLSALIGAAKLLGYEGKDILEMVKEIVNKD
ncbi:hypothetical protein G6F35_006815 [Rhizopus arrhizus]|nr:hypothetical protein G6F35_006815 [Rhizopus arrhizus]